MEAALRLFSERGFAGTSVGECAAEADVAVDTIYKTFGSKLGIVEALVDAAGPDEAIAETRKQWTGARGDPAGQLAIYTRRVGGFWSHNDRLVSFASHGAGGTEVTRLWNERQAIRRAFITSLLDDWPDEVFRPGLRRADAADLIWSLTSNDTFHLLVFEGGWSPERWGHEIGIALARTLLAEVPAAAGVSTAGGSVA